MNKLVASVLLNSRKLVRKECPGWHDIQQMLESVRQEEGRVVLEVAEQHETGPENITVAASEGNYLITLLEYSEYDSEVRSYWHGEFSGRKIVINGELWPDNQITSDFSVVVAVFKEFFETGNVSNEVLN